MPAGIRVFDEKTVHEQPDVMEGRGKNSASSLCKRLVVLNTCIILECLRF